MQQKSVENLLSYGKPASTVLKFVTAARASRVAK